MSVHKCVLATVVLLAAAASLSESASVTSSEAASFAPFEVVPSTDGSGTGRERRALANETAAGGGVLPLWTDTRNALRVIAGPDLARLHFENEPYPHLVVELATDEVPKRIAEFLRTSPAPVKVKLGAAMPVDEIVALTDRFVTEWLREAPEILGIDVDASSGAVILDVSDRGAEIAQLVQEDLEPYGVQVRWHTLEGFAAPMRRGGYIIDEGCTVGFSVERDDGERATTTASHCANQYRWKNLQGGDWQTTSLMSEVYSASADIQASRTTLDPQALFYAATTQAWREVLYSVARSDMDGDPVCHRGVRTGYSCGEVTSIVYRPTWDRACGEEECAAEWPKVEGQDLACSNGDSGGPTFYANTAYGLLSGGVASGTADGECSLFVFTPMGKYRQLDMNLLKR